MGEDFFLDVLIVTHNHEKFIEKCVLSAINQISDYRYRIVILDDCSTDNTLNILNKIKSDSALNITIIHNEENLGVLRSAALLSTYAKSRYVCFMDGDDEWTYNRKIQTQLDFLEQNPEFAGTFHDASIQHHFTSQTEDFLKTTQNEWKAYSQFNRYREVFMPWDLINRNIIPTASLIYRNVDITHFISNFKQNAYSLSWAIHLELIKQSKFKYFNETWSVYNDHPQGISKKFNVIDFKFNNIKILESLLEDNCFHHYKSEIYRSICNEFFLLLKSQKTLESSKKEYFTLLKKYKKYLKQLIRYDLEQFKMDYNYVQERKE